MADIKGVWRVWQSCGNIFVTDLCCPSVSPPQRKQLLSARTYQSRGVLPFPAYHCTRSAAVADMSDTAQCTNLFGLTQYDGKCEFFGNGKPLGHRLLRKKSM